MLNSCDMLVEFLESSPDDMERGRGFWYRELAVGIRRVRSWDAEALTDLSEIVERDMRSRGLEAALIVVEEESEFEKKMRELGATISQVRSKK